MSDIDADLKAILLEATDMTTMDVARRLSARIVGGSAQASLMYQNEPEQHALLVQRFLCTYWKLHKYSERRRVSCITRAARSLRIATIMESGRGNYNIKRGYSCIDTSNDDDLLDLLDGGDDLDFV